MSIFLCCTVWSETFICITTCILTMLSTRHNHMLNKMWQCSMIQSDCSLHHHLTYLFAEEFKFHMAWLYESGYVGSEVLLKIKSYVGGNVLYFIKSYRHISILIYIWNNIYQPQKLFWFMFNHYSVCKKNILWNCCSFYVMLKLSLCLTFR